MTAYYVLPAYILFAMNLAAVEAAVQGEFERSLTVSAPVELDLATDSGGIVVTQGPAGVVKIHAILKARNSTGDAEQRIRRIERNPPIELIGNRIRIGVPTHSALLKGISMRLEIEAPAASRLWAQADSGGVRVEGINGPVDCKTDSGGIEVSRIGAEVRATADSGGIRIREVQGSVYARADSGGVEAVGVAGPIDVATDSGGIRIQQTQAAVIRAHADSGGADVRLSPGQGYNLALKTDSGRISTPGLDGGANVSRNQARGKIRGGGPLVDVNVDSGKIVVN